jgi:hypothetical protein
MKVNVQLFKDQLECNCSSPKCHLINASPTSIITVAVCECVHYRFHLVSVEQGPLGPALPDPSLN